MRTLALAHAKLRLSLINYLSLWNSTAGITRQTLDNDKYILAKKVDYMHKPTLNLFRSLYDIMTAITTKVRKFLAMCV